MNENGIKRTPTMNDSRLAMVVGGRLDLKVSPKNYPARLETINARRPLHDGIPRKPSDRQRKKAAKKQKKWKMFKRAQFPGQIVVRTSAEFHVIFSLFSAYCRLSTVNGGGARTVVLISWILIWVGP